MTFSAHFATIIGLISATTIGLGCATSVAFAQAGSVGGTIGNRERSISGESSEPRQGAPRRKRGGRATNSEPAATGGSSIDGQWNWQGGCPDGRNWRGGFILRNSSGSISGEFNGGHPGTLTGRFSGTRVSFT